MDTLIPALGLKPVGYQILVRICTRGEKYGSIILPDNTKQNDSYVGMVGQVIDFGPKVFQGKQFEDEDNTPRYKKGDFVIFSQHGAKRVPYENQIYFLMADDVPLATIDDPLKTLGK